MLIDDASWYSSTLISLLPTTEEVLLFWSVVGEGVVVVVVPVVALFPVLIRLPGAGVGAGLTTGKGGSPGLEDEVVGEAGGGGGGVVVVVPPPVVVVEEGGTC